MAEKVKTLGVRREKGFLYFIDAQGDVSRSPMARGSGSKGSSQKIAQASIVKESGFLYYLDKDGDISRSPMSRGR